MGVFLGVFFWPCPEARGIFVPQPGMEPVSPAVEARSLNHWTTREVPSLCSSCLPGLNSSYHWHSFLLPHGWEISDFMCHMFYMSCLPVLLVARGVGDLPKFIMSQIQAPVRCRPAFLPTTVCVSKLKKKTGL